MSELPSGWAPIKLGEVAEFKYGKALPAQNRDGGEYPVFGSNGIVGHHSTWLSSAPTIVIGRKGSVGEVCYSESNCSPIDTTYYVNHFDFFDPKFCFYLLKQLNLNELNKSTAIPGLSRQDAYELEINLVPLAEQTRIAQKLDDLLAQVDTLKARLDTIPALLKRFRQSTLAAAVSGRLTADWRAEFNSSIESAPELLLKLCEQKKSWLKENPDHNEAGRVRKRVSAPKSSMLDNGELPDSWCWARLEDIVLLVVDCHNKTAPYEPHGIPLVRTSNIRDGQFVWDNLRFVSQATYGYWSKRCVPESGDIVFTREAPMGEAAIIPKGKQICLGQRTMLIRTIESCTSAKFILTALLDPKFKERAADMAVGTGVKHFRVGDVSELLIPLAPTEEQTEIVRRVEQLFAFTDQLEAKIKTAQARVNHLTQSILAKAFRGELVPQDPNDEPASELLARIKAQRAAAPKAKRGRKASA